MLILMSFKPLFAFEVVEGKKKCEVRTAFLPIKPKDMIMVYASTPLKSVVGEFTVGNVVIYSKYPELVSSLNKFCGKLSYDNLKFITEKYRSSRRKLVVFEVINPVKFSNYITLDTLRKYLGNTFKPPRSYVIIRTETNTYKTLISLREKYR